MPELFQSEYITFAGQPIAERDQAGAWTDYIFAGGKRIAKVVSAPAVLHLHGVRDGNTVCLGCGVEGALNGVPPGLAGITIQSGDRLSVDMLQTINGQGGATYGGLTLFHDNIGC